MKNCNHNKKCFQCVQEEIKELEIKLKELKDLLPPEQISFPYIPYTPALSYSTNPFPYNPINLPYYVGDYPIVLCTKGNEQISVC